jgi:hypothetical protein
VLWLISDQGPALNRLAAGTMQPMPA